MPTSRFWWSIVTICSILSGVYVMIQAFQALKRRFSPGEGQLTSEERSQSVVIMGLGSRFIAPTRIELTDIEDIVNHASPLFSRLPRKTTKRVANKGQLAEPVASTTAILSLSKAETELQPDGPVLQLPVAMPQVHATKRSPARRALVLVSALALTAIIAASFLFSVRLFSASLTQSGNAQAKVVPTKPAQPQLARPAFERGIIYPQWNNDGYGVNDTTWQQSVASLKTQTGAQWIEIPVLFSQATSSSTVVGISSSAPTVQSFTEGVERAHNLGYKVFFVPLMQVRQAGGWSGSITFKTLAQQQAWFDSYWNAIVPYVTAASSQHVDQMAIGTELQTLQKEVPDALWNQLIGHIRGVFNGTLTYDMNWSSLTLSMPAWLHNSGLTYIGVSTYIPLLAKAGRIAPKDMPAMWRDKIKTQLDALAVQLGKQVLITEIGYRNSSDALYRPWEAQTKAKADPQEQAGAYDAALTNVFQDAHIAGTFFWGWDDVGQLAINGQPATQVLLKWYTLKQT